RCTNLVYIYSHLFSIFFFYSSSSHRYLHSFPTRRSSDLVSILVSSAYSFSSLNSLPKVPLPSLTSATRALTTTVREVNALVAERSEEHTSELQSPYDLVCRLLLEKKKIITSTHLSIQMNE